MSRKTAFQAMDISLNTFTIFAEMYYVLSKLMLCFYVLKIKLSCLVLSSDETAGWLWPGLALAGG